jgi:hypothetical protein
MILERYHRDKPDVILVLQLDVFGMTWSWLSSCMGPIFGGVQREYLPHYGGLQPHHNHTLEHNYTSLPTTAKRDLSHTCTRTRTGCWTCRACKKKCDETRPHCQTCRSLDLVCEGYGIRLKWTVRGTSRVTFQHKSPGREKLEGKTTTPTSHPTSWPVTPINNSTEHDSILLQYLGQEIFNSLSEFERRLLHDYKGLLFDLQLFVVLTNRQLPIGDLPHSFQHLRDSQTLSTSRNSLPLRTIGTPASEQYYLSDYTGSQTRSIC